MQPSRRRIILLAALAAAAGLLYVLREPAKAPTLQDPAAAAALPLELPTAGPAGMAQPHAPVQAAAPARLPAPEASAPRIGSEGYGPHIERAQAGGDAAAAWEAVQWLQQCASNSATRQSYESVRGGRIPQEMLTQLMLEADAEGRLCQTVTAWHWAMLQELALRAIRGGVPNSAVGLATMIKPGDITPALRQEVSDAIRRDADSGEPGSMLGALTDGAAWGLSDDERLGYLVAFSELDGNGGPALVRQWLSQGTVEFKTAPTAQQLSAARAAGQQIADRIRAGRLP
ncbi:hypothetical protein [Roseateles sp.]|uniref:hypothetical protein n=1 Tax=Roseateles sp. TaxID=1971397 RepID=UPI0039EB3114